MSKSEEVSSRKERERGMLLSYFKLISRRLREAILSILVSSFSIIDDFSYVIWKQWKKMLPSYTRGGSGLPHDVPDSIFSLFHPLFHLFRDIRYIIRNHSHHPHLSLVSHTAPEEEDLC
jgi:hypothetical protein